MWFQALVLFWSLCLIVSQAPESHLLCSTLSTFSRAGVGSTEMMCVKCQVWCWHGLLSGIDSYHVYVPLGQPHSRALKHSCLVLFFFSFDALGAFYWFSFRKYGMLHEFMCHPYGRAMLIFSVLFQFFSTCAAKVSTWYFNQLWLQAA